MDHGINARYSLALDENANIPGMRCVQADAAYMVGSALIGKVLARPTRWQRFKNWVRSIW